MARAATTAIANNASYDVSATYLNNFVADYVSQSDTADQALVSDLNVTALKRIKSNFFYFNPSTAPATTEGHIYYDSSADLLYCRDTATWMPLFSGYDAVVKGSGDKTTTIQAAIDGLTGGRSRLETVYLKGYFTISATITIPNWTRLIIDGGLIAATNLNAPILENEDQATHNFQIDIEGASPHCFIDGNRVNQSGAGGRDGVCRGIEFIGATEPDNLWTDYIGGQPLYVVRNLMVRNCKSEGIYCNFDGAGIAHAVLLDNVSALQNIGGAVHWYVVNDSQIIGGLYDATNAANIYALDLEGVNVCTIHPDYVNGRSYFNLCRYNNIMFRTYSDNLANYDSITWLGSYQNIFHDTVFHFDTGTDNTYDGIKMADSGATHSDYNQFSGLKFYSPNNNFLYGIEESDANQDNNMYTNIDGTTCQTGALRLLGAASQSLHSQIQGTVAEV